MRVEQLSHQSGVSVDTIRYYQSKGLLDPPRREGRVAWYDGSHLDRLARVRVLQQHGFSLATIARVVNGDLDAADEALLVELTGAASPPTGRSGAVPSRADEQPVSFTLDELASRTGVPLALLKAVEAEGLLIPRWIGGHERYTEEDVDACRAGLVLLEHGIPLSVLLEEACNHREATDSLARVAVELFSDYVRAPLREGADGSGAGDVTGLVEAYSALLPAVTTLVGYHFTRTLLKAALEHVERTGDDAERRAVASRVGAGDVADTGADDDPRP
jgi:DNA-binding transcriptional MerR regulator